MNNLNSFDIASYDIELEYISNIAPIKKKIIKLNKNHETKSLKSHKDFLAKEKKSKEKLQLLVEKAIIKDQRIEKAVENKLIKLRSKDQRFKNDFNIYKITETEIVDSKIADVKQVIQELKVGEMADIKAVQQKYQENVKSYIEKLEIYTNNYENNHKIHIDQIEKYSKLLNAKLIEIDSVKSLLDTEIALKLDKYIEIKKAENAQSETKLHETEISLNNEIQKIKKDSNIKVKGIRDNVEILQKKYETRFTKYISKIEQQIEFIKSEFEDRKIIIDKDLQVNLNKLNNIEEETQKNKSKNSRKTIKMKIDLFNLRAYTSKKYEESVLNERILLLENEIDLLRTTLVNEISNLEKLEIFLLNDQVEIKDTGDYFKNINIKTKTELNVFERANNDYLVQHEHLKTEFIRKYTDLFDGFKQSLLSLNKSSIEQLTVINQEIDEINKYLDTSEPLKEIEVNKLRENIEVTEIKERYNIKYAKQEYEINILNNELQTRILIKETNMKSLMSENNKEITNVKNKEILDKAIEKAKLKYNKATEIYKLRLNSTKLEGNVLESDYETKLEILDFEKEIVRFEVQKDDILLSKKLNNDIKNIETETNYKIEVINKRLEEDLLKQDEQVSRLVYEKDTFSSNVDLAISKETIEVNKKKDNVINEANIKYSNIDIALERETKELSLNVLKSESIINERINKLNTNNSIYSDFINKNTKKLFEESLTVNQIKEFVSSNMLIHEETSKYINNLYNSLKEALSFMKELEKRSILNRIASSIDQNRIKKLKKQLTKNELELKKQLNILDSSKTEKILILKNKINSNISKFSKQKTDDIEILREIIINIYDSTFTSLKILQKNILDEITVLYSPLTKTNKAIISNAETNAKKAKKLVNDEKMQKLKQLNEFLTINIEKHEEERRVNLEKLEIQINDFKDKISQMSQKSTDEINEIKDKSNKLITIKKEQLRLIEDSEEKEIIKQIELLDIRKSDLEKVYKTTLEQLHKKDQEAKKIYAYEEKIYNIALETANSRFNDANVKSENVNFSNINENNKKIKTLKSDSENYLKLLNQRLLDKTKHFENNIYTIHPKSEESIGIAQKAIEEEILIKTKRLQFLTETHANITQSLENNLYTAFQEGYEQLIYNLNTYLEKYKVIGDNYRSLLDSSNVIISENNIAFANALFELGSKKHEIVKRNLIQINTKIT